LEWKTTAIIKTLILLSRLKTIVLLNTFVGTWVLFSGLFYELKIHKKSIYLK